MLNLYLLFVNVTSLHLHEFTFIICNLWSQELDTKPLKYGLHHSSFTDKNKFFKSNVTVEVWNVAANLDHYFEQCTIFVYAQI